MLALGCGAAQASETVLGGGFARECQLAAERTAIRLFVDPQAAAACTIAIDGERLSTKDLAATHVNRGIVALGQRDYRAAEKDFDAAIELVPTMGGAYTNRGAALIGEGEDAAAIAEIDRGLGLGAPEPEKAWFNRALAHEALGDLKSAYLDYLQAAQLKPGWSDPARELARFKVTTRRTVTG
jgi:tetratricopeptide (TPR) repeat protein